MQTVVQPASSGTPTPSAAPAVESTAVLFLPSLSSYQRQGSVVTDGPWEVLPSTADSGLKVAEEVGGLTLDSDISDLTYVLRPDPDLSDAANTVAELASYAGRLYLGYGDVAGNGGPVDILSYDPTTGIAVRELDDVPEEQTGGWYIAPDGRLYVCGVDSREDWTLGSFYLLDDLGWHKLRTVYKALHIKALAQAQGVLYAGYASDATSPVQYPFVLSSHNNGASWSYERLDDIACAASNVDDVAVVWHGSESIVYAAGWLRTTSDVYESWLYRLAGGVWERVYFTGAFAGFQPDELFVYGERLLVKGQLGGKVEVLALDGEVPVKASFLTDRLASFARCATVDGYLTCILQDFVAESRYSYSVYQSKNLVDWSLLGVPSLPKGSVPISLATAQGRFYVGVRGGTGSGGNASGLYAASNTSSEEGAEYRSPVYDLSQPIAQGTLFFEASEPAGTSLRFQVRSAASHDELAEAEFCGPDGEPTTYYEASGESLWSGNDGHTYIQYRAILTSSNPTLAPILRRVVVLTRDDGLAQLELVAQSADCVAGEGLSLTVVARSATGGVLPVDAVVSLEALDAESGAALKVSPVELSLTQGVGTAQVVLRRAVPTQLCATLAGVSACIQVDVQPGPVSALAVSTDLSVPQPNWSAVGVAGAPFGVTVIALDSSGNVATSYTGTVTCDCWQWTAADASLLTYTFRSQDRGYQTFPLGMTIPWTGEWNIVCSDVDHPHIAGSVTVRMDAASEQSE